MNEKEYLENRLDNQIDWYDRNSRYNQEGYKLLRIAEIIAAACIPFLAAYMAETSQLRIVVGTLGIFVTIIAGVISLYRFQELWVEYRTTAEALKHEKFLFATRTPPYDIKEPFTLLVERAESLVSKEHSRWTRHIKKRSTDRGIG